jgi:WD40 repeat protein
LVATNAHRHLVAGTAFSPDGTQAASVAQDGTLALWDASSLACINNFKGHMLGIYSVVFSPDSRRFATGGGGRETVKFWDLATGHEMLTLPGNGSLIGYVGFSPDGNWPMARSSLQGQLHLWHAPSWAEIDAAEKRAEGKTQ